MHYLIQPRGPGTGWVFRMVTPPELVGMENPWTGKPFGREIRRGLKTRHLPEARKRRDVALGEIRKLADTGNGADDFSLEKALEWRQMVAEDSSDEGAVGSILGDRLEAAESRGVPLKKLQGFGKVAFGKGFPISKAFPQYLEERKPGNRRGYKPLQRTTILNAETALRHLRDFLGDEDRVACLEDVTPEKARRFREDYLPSLTTRRSPEVQIF
ncbi:hypothetical protein [Roseovarius salinarum]|uniref:hypothetical protein n=1 Tax=Roseovarius salinarum TaxID=1981892 RepID=UPI0012FFFBCC|nr:hypothetical protein [Roseovarius salinarum]